MIEFHRKGTMLDAVDGSHRNAVSNTAQHDIVSRDTVMVNNWAGHGRY